MRPFLLNVLAILSFLFFCSFLNSGNVLNEKYKPGYYIDTSGKVEGYIYFTYDNYQKFNFKKNLDDKKGIKRVEECTSFFVDGKTFKVINEVYLKVGVWNLFAEKAFAEVVIEGPMNLYKVYSMVGNGNMNAPGAIDVTNYILEKNNDKSYVLAHPKKSKFKSEMIELFSDREDIVEKIKNRSYNISNITDLVNDYNNKP